MKLLTQLKLTLARLAFSLQPSAFVRKRTALANISFPGQLGGWNDHGRLSGFVDGSVTLPVANRYLVWVYGADQNHFAICTGANTQAQRPIGISPDSPSSTVVGATLQLALYAFGGKPGTMIGLAAGAITHGHLVCTAAGGQIADVTTQANGTYWVIGECLTDATVQGAECVFQPCFPFLYNNQTNAVTSV